MTIKYEYNSTCCNHFYVETRNDDDAQVVTKCNVCGTGEYQETNRTEIESIPSPIYEVNTEEMSPKELANQKLLDFGLTQEEIDALINEQTI